jgi:type IV secretory pathway VirB2 component (pilin)
MKKYTIILILILLLGFALQGAHASVVDPNEPCNAPTNPTNLPPCVYGSTPAGFGYHYLAPLQQNQPDFDYTQANNIGAYLNLLIKLFIGLCAVLAVVMIVIGGIEYMTSELLSGKEHGRERLTGAVLGLLVALGAYALLYTINPDILKTDIDSSLTQATLIADLNADVPQTAVNGKYSSGASYGAPWDDSAAGLQTLPSGVSVYNAQCTFIGQTNCTSTRGLNLNYINKIQAYCSACTSLSITGGTEYWLHGGKTGSTSHQVGSATVDLNPTAALTQYITGGQTPVYMHRYSRDGVSYLYEGNHWHAGS